VDLIAEIMQPLAEYILVTFLATEVIKHLVRAWFKYDPAKWTIFISVVIGILLSYGWTLSVLPEPDRPGFEWVAVVLTGLIVAGAAAGVFSWMSELFPWYRELNAESKLQTRR
jgi:uncharacterized membrane protein AbrB (regulator of aidB expression)